MTQSPVFVILATIALIVLSALFVIMEFSLLAARRRRLEAEAGTSRAARAALRSVDELTIMLAGAQLGITLATFALGAITKPAVDAWLGPVLTGWGLPAAVAGTASFFLSLLLVTFLHLVVGEMAPKSWAIAHPEFAAKAVAGPARAYVWAVRPLLAFANDMANRLVAASGVTPTDRAAVGGHDAESIRQLVEHSASSGALDEQAHGQISGALDLQDATVGDLVSPPRDLVTVPADATVEDVQAASVASGHLRILVRPAAGPDDGVPGVVHVRDTMVLGPREPVAPLVQEALTLPVDTALHEASSAMRAAGRQLAVVTSEGRTVGVVTLTDLFRRVLPVSG